jgi:hypothetical protein
VRPTLPSEATAIAGRNAEIPAGELLTTTGSLQVSPPSVEVVKRILE